MALEAETVFVLQELIKNQKCSIDGCNEDAFKLYAKDKFLCKRHISRKDSNSGFIRGKIIFKFPKSFQGDC